MMLSKKLLVFTLGLVTLVSFLLVNASSDQNNHRGDKLFNLFPLHSSISDLYTKFIHNYDGNQRDTNNQERINQFNIELSNSVDRIKSLEEKQMIDFIKEYETLDNRGKWKLGYKPQEIKETIFHNYDANALVLYGTADFSYVKELLKDELYEPISLGHTDKTMVTLWIVDHKDTSVGAHKELFITVHVAKKEKGQTLGVSYEDGNAASLLYPIYGKLPKHSRLYVLHSVIDNKNDFARLYKRNIHGFPVQKCSANIRNVENLLNSKGEKKDFTQFEFKDEKGNLIVKGSIEDDNTWTSWFNTTKKIFHALGLSSILDLLHSTHATIKMVGRKSVSPRMTKLQMDMKQRIHEIKDNHMEYGQSTEIGKSLKDMNFKPEMVVKMPLFQYALSSTIHTDDDKEYMGEKLKYEEK